MDVFTSLDSSTTTDVLELVDTAAIADGLPAVGEQPLLKLRHGSDDTVFHLLDRDDDGRLIAYANLDAAGTGPLGVELVVHPAHRRRGVGARLVAAVVDKGTDLGRSAVNAWAHGDHPSAVALADRFGFTRERVLYQMRRRLDADWPTVDVPDVTIRTFQPGRDEQALLTVNNAAFADHPDQGGWTVRDLVMREREAWFDPAGLFLAENSDGELLGFHWTKVHGDGDAQVGEVYVLGVSPRAQGMRLGTALTAVGLRHLRDRGLATVMLYVDESNTAAVRLYTGQGFVRWITDVGYRRQLG
ncbi:mycothiol synthase [Stackebrandtia soli]|uniref:mycothiol synthase n=1 Tax=Stackebrandtia soli TaxID=1892856 RepID=UPI0039E857DB